ncbi:MAG TPA: hypothetical protein VFZ61_12725 [Polyangiales bacterium]
MDVSRFALCLSVTLLLLLGSAARSSAQVEWVIAQPSDEIRLTDLSLGAVFDGGEGFGVTPGFQMGIPLVNAGLIPAINDSLFLEPGLLVSVRIRKHEDDLAWVVPELGPRWNFHLAPTWDVFASVKLGWAIGREGDLWLRGTLGSLWWFVPSWSLRAEFAYGAVVGAGGYLGMGYRFL